MSKPTPQYVQRALGRIVGEARTEAINGVTAIQRRNSAAGRLDSGNTLVDSNEAMLALMKAMMKRGAETTFNAFEEVTDGGVRLLMNFGQALAKTVAAPVIEWAEADKGGPSAGIKAKMADELQERLQRMLNDELDDFSDGMHGGARFKKEPVVNSIINNTMNNSPGAVQQAGVGKFSQSAFTQQTAHLTQAIDAFLLHPSSAACPGTKRRGCGRRGRPQARTAQSELTRGNCADGESVCRALRKNSVCTSRLAEFGTH